MNSIQYSVDNDNIVTLKLNRQDAAVNKLDAHFRHDLHQIIDHLKGERETIQGIILTSGKSTFFAGADLEELLTYQKADQARLTRAMQQFKADLVELESLGVPVCAALNGSALGGGWEIALACHHRVAIQHKSIRFGLPEVKLGLLPGGGGIVRSCRLLGLEAALPLLTEGRELDAATMQQHGLIHSLVDDEDQLMTAAKKWLLSRPEPGQPWQSRHYRIPGGAPQMPKLAKKLPAAPAFLTAKTKGCYPAPEAILKAAVEGLQVDFATALKIETDYFIELVNHPVSHNMIKTFFFGLNAINKGASRPEAQPQTSIAKVGILGAGMMGAGIAYATAKSGLQTILKDVSLEQAQSGKAYSEKLLQKRRKRGQISADDAEQLLKRITPTTTDDDLKDCDLIIEAVFEDRTLKAKLTQETEPCLNNDGIFASNTSTLPISSLAKASAKPDKFIGLHFFSPVDKMQLVEIIVGDQTSEATLAKAFDFVRQIKKTPIVVNDSRGFFTSRVFGTFTNEGIAMLGEGVAPASIERAALTAGMPVGPLAVSDEVSLSLMMHVIKQTANDFAEQGRERPVHPAEAVIQKMVSMDRVGRKNGAGFYEYPQEQKKYLWPELATQFNSQADRIPLQDIQDRLLFIQALETVRCLEEGVLRSVLDANIGSIFGFGFAPWSGGALQFINHYGLRPFVERSLALAEAYGERFNPSALLREKAEANTNF
jgi:3-hydroxyacyl-CoA dehydrogenase/enoyl-CoA hydratase/3-hydroxybutyryl-CoA epimerase